MSPTLRAQRIAGPRHARCRAGPIRSRLQADRILLNADDGEFGPQDRGSVIASRCVQSALMWLRRLPIQALVGRVPRRPKCCAIAHIAMKVRGAPQVICGPLSQPDLRGRVEAARERGHSVHNTLSLGQHQPDAYLLQRLPEPGDLRGRLGRLWDRRRAP